MFLFIYIKQPVEQPELKFQWKYAKRFKNQTKLVKICKKFKKKINMPHNLIMNLNIIRFISLVGYTLFLEITVELKDL